MSLFASMRELAHKFLDVEDDSEHIFITSPAQPNFSYMRAVSTLRRVRVVSVVFLVLVPCWIAIDAAVFPWPLASEFMIARVATSALFFALAIYTLLADKKARWPHAYAAVVVMMLIPTAFGLTVDAQIDAWKAVTPSITPLQGIAVRLYTLLPMIFVGGIALFPLAVVESIPLVGLMAAFALLRGMREAGPLPADNIADAWVIVLAGSAIAIGSLMHLQFAWHAFIKRQLDPETKLLTREAALSGRSFQRKFTHRDPVDLHTTR